MIQLNGIPVEFEISSLTRVNDLIYYDGPLLTNYISNDGFHYLFYLVDSDKLYNRWMIFKTDEQHLFDYIDNKTTLYNIITNCLNNYVTFIDIDNNKKLHNQKNVEVQNIPTVYLPDKDATYDF